MRRGLAYGAGAYVWWGLSPLFWKLLEDVAAIDVVAHRAVWAFVLLALAHTVRSSWTRLRAVAGDRRNQVVALCTATLLATNWGVFLWAVATDRVLDVSLGYFINPLMSVVLGVVLLREQMRPAQWVAVGLAAAGVAWFVIEVGSVPLVSLVLAGTFAVYGLLRKTASFGSVDGLTMETGIMSIGAVLLLAVRAAQGAGTIGAGAPGQSVLLMLAGGVTAVPLLLFAASARRVPLSVVGLLQYLAPSIQFVLGVWVFDETFGRSRLVGFALIWVALAVLVVDGLRAGSAADAVPSARPDG
ncbi:MAG: EamA family transporter RarD [Acidimicrobiia bacterium]|nr:EamA family transporter RarD [Acidimicrobiia bacterium]